MRVWVIFADLTVLQTLFYRSTAPTLVHKLCDAMTRPQYFRSLRVSPIFPGFSANEVLFAFYVHSWRRTR